jgi:hypothetical protein
MQLTKLRAAPVRAYKVPPCAPGGGTDGGTASQPSRSGAQARERFEGEHPRISWSPGRDGKAPFAGYAPSEYRLKQWPHEALSGAWCPRLAGAPAGFEIERVAGRFVIDRVAELAPADPVARVGATPRWCWGHDRPSQEQACGRLGEVFS